jgi:hypothetical protein
MGVAVLVVVVTVDCKQRTMLQLLPTTQLEALLPTTTVAVAAAVANQTALVASATAAAAGVCAAHCNAL